MHYTQNIVQNDCHYGHAEKAYTQGVSRWYVGLSFAGNAKVEIKPVRLPNAICHPVAFEVHDMLAYYDWHCADYAHRVEAQRTVQCVIVAVVSEESYRTTQRHQEVEDDEGESSSGLVREVGQKQTPMVVLSTAKIEADCSRT
jgi:hypothetical protein